MDNQNKVILVTGATGQQGGAVARHLLSNGWKVRAFTRDLHKPEANALIEFGAELVKGDFDDHISLERALDGAYGAFSVQNFWDGGVVKEVEHGKLFADAVKDSTVQHLVYSSVGSANMKTGIPHFESKWEIEEYIRSLELKTTIVRPVFFMENFFMPDWRQGINNGTLALALKKNKPLQIVGVDDIGGFVAQVFNSPELYIGKSFELAGDELSGSEMVDVLSKKSGNELNFMELPIEQVRKYSDDMAIMFEWFNEKGYQTDIAQLRKLYPNLKSFEEWFDETGYRIFNGKN